MALTDIPGIGAKTAEKLRGMGVSDKQELFRRFENRDPAIVGGAGKSGLNSRALDGIRDALFEQGRTFRDPVMGIEVGPEDRAATEKLGTKTLGDLSSVDVTQANAGDGGSFRADQTLGELAEPAAEGRLGSQDAPQSIIGWAADAAGNLGVSDLDSGQIQDVNRINRDATGFETTAPSVAKRNELPPEATEQYDLDAREVARAESYHESRPEKAQRVDERRDAPVTDEITKWKGNPSHFDYPGVDTPSDVDEFFAEGRTSSSFGLGTSTVRNRDDQKLRRSLNTIDRADPEAQEQALGEPVEFSMDRLFSDD